MPNLPACLFQARKSQVQADGLAGEYALPLSVFRQNPMPRSIAWRGLCNLLRSLPI